MEEILLYGVLAINCVTFLAYAIDKLLAVWHWRRISERCLLTFTLLCGGVGALLAMIICRHKIRKFRFWFCAVFSTLLLGTLYYWVFVVHH